MTVFYLSNVDRDHSLTMSFESYISICWCDIHIKMYENADSSLAFLVNKIKVTPKSIFKQKI